MMSTEPSTSAPLWDEQTLQNPHAVADKRGRVQQMFTAIAPSYDLCNRLHSLGIDVLWRRKAVKLSKLAAGETVVDIACGTGDLTLEFANALRRLNTSNSAWSSMKDTAAGVLGIDFTYAMLPIARRKGQRLGVANWINGDAASLPLPSASADVVSIAFGIRNVAEPGLAIAEFYRILRPGGRLVILEFSLPTNPLVRGLYNFYFRQILPRTATLISGDKTGAYRYLPESVNSFIDRSEMARLMSRAGFVDLTQTPLTMGICVCYVGRKS